MKKLLFVLSVGLSMFARADSFIIMSTITVTNAANLTNGVSSLTVNGIVRTWVSTVTNTPSNILISTNATIGADATSLFTAFAISPQPSNSTMLSRSGTNGIVLRFAQGVVSAITRTAGWGYVTNVTNAVTSAVDVTIPLSVIPADKRTNITSGLIDWLNLGTVSELAPNAPGFVAFGAYWAAHGTVTATNAVVHDLNGIATNLTDYVALTVTNTNGASIRWDTAFVPGMPYIYYSTTNATVNEGLWATFQSPNAFNLVALQDNGVAVNSGRAIQAVRTGTSITDLFLRSTARVNLNAPEITSSGTYVSPQVQNLNEVGNLTAQSNVVIFGTFSLTNGPGLYRTTFRNETGPLMISNITSAAGLKFGSLSSSVGLELNTGQGTKFTMGGNVATFPNMTVSTNLTVHDNVLITGTDPDTDKLLINVLNNNGDPIFRVNNTGNVDIYDQTSNQTNGNLTIAGNAIIARDLTVGSLTSLNGDSGSNIYESTINWTNPISNVTGRYHVDTTDTNDPGNFNLSFSKDGNVMFQYANNEFQIANGLQINGGGGIVILDEATNGAGGSSFSLGSANMLTVNPSLSYGANGIIGAGNILVDSDSGVSTSGYNYILGNFNRIYKESGFYSTTFGGRNTNIFGSYLFNIGYTNTIAGTNMFAIGTHIRETNNWMVCIGFGDYGTFEIGTNSIVSELPFKVLDAVATNSPPTLSQLTASTNRAYAFMTNLIQNGGTLINTNFIVDQLYTNNYGALIQISSDAALTVAAAAGMSQLSLEVAGIRTNRASILSAIGVVTGVITNGMTTMYVPSGSTYKFHNTSTAAGGSAAPSGGQIFIP